MTKFLYRFLILPLSILPLSILYLFRPFLYFVVFYVLGYRKMVVMGNIERSFPDLNEKSRRDLAKNFYWHLCALLIEGLKNLSITDKELKNRMSYKNLDLVKTHAAQNRNIILVSGHYGNWEWVITSLGLNLSNNLFGLGMPMTDKFWDQEITAKRERFGLKVIHSKNYKEALKSKQPFVLLMLADQSPGDTNKSYWMSFLNQQTAIPFGTEFLAHEHQAVVIYYACKPNKRGHYIVDFELISDFSKPEAYGEITEKFTHCLEREIKENPAFWMWSHKRWKRTPPESFDALRKEQIANFENRKKK